MNESASKGLPRDEREVAVEILNRAVHEGRFDSLQENEVTTSLLERTKTAAKEVLRTAIRAKELIPEFFDQWAIVAFPDGRQQNRVCVTIVRNDSKPAPATSPKKQVELKEGPVRKGGRNDPPTSPRPQGHPGREPRP